LIAHGSATNSFKLLLDGMPQMTWIADGSVGVPPADNIGEEVNLQYSALPAEYETGGVMYNLVPKTGSNSYKASLFTNFTTSKLQSSNVTDALKAQGLFTGGDIDYVTEVAPALGGPIQQDKLWFFTTYRDFRPYMYSTMFYDSNKTDYLYTPDMSRKPAYD